MKKVLALAVAAAMVLALAACGGSSSTNSASAAPAAAPAAAASSAASTAAPAAEKSEAAPAADAGDLGEPVTIKMNDFAPAALPFGQGMLAAKDYIESTSGGNMTVDIYFDGSVLGFNDSYQGVKEGVVDLAIVGPAATDSIVTLNSVFTTMQKYLPQNPMDVTTSCYELLDTVPALQEEMIATAGVRWAGMYALFGSSVHCKGITPKTPEDLKGVSIESLGGTAGYWQLLGANALTLDPGDYYIDMERGVIDAQATHWPSLDGYAMYELTDYHLMFGEDGGGCFFGVMGYIVNEEKWQSLTPAQQKILWDGMRVGAELSTELDVPSAEHSKQYCIDDGDEFYYLYGEELNPWIAYMDQFNSEWEEKVNAAGFDGTGTLKTLQDILAKY